jgi:PucR family transcriptional regulator, purine catabolism regulatory protein
MVTVRDLLADLDGVRLLTGEPAVDVPVRWVHITELKDPTPWLSGGELLLTTGMQLNTPARQREFVDRLADHRLAGLGFGIGFGHREVPPALVEAARDRDFPVFEIPYETPFIAVTEAAFTQLVNEQYAVLRRALAAHERLERVVLAEQGLEAVAGALATLIGGAVLVCDARGEPLAVHAFRRALEDGLVAALSAELEARRSGDAPARPFLPVHAELADRALALPVSPDGGQARRAGPPTPTAWLVAIKDTGPLSDFDRLTLHQAVTIVALELLRERVAGDTERRLAGDVLAGIVSGELTGPELGRRLAPFGLEGEVAAIVVPRPAGTRPARARELEDALAAVLREEAVGSLVASTEGLTCALIDAAHAAPEPLAEAAARRLRTTVGLGRPVDGPLARRSFHEARCAVEALGFATPASADGGGAPAPRVATYKDLGSFQLLLSLQDEESLRLFCDSILGPIEAGDGHYGGELMRSLEAFIEENGQWERAAKRLYCHRHTLRYRIRRVEELTGRSLSSARDRIEFWLALRGREITT